MTKSKQTGSKVKEASKSGKSLGRPPKGAKADAAAEKKQFDVKDPGERKSGRCTELENKAKAKAKSDAKAKAKALVAACKEVLSSDKLERLLKKMLAVGNVMNQGTFRGQASGFTVDSLLRMIQTKGKLLPDLF